MYLADTPISKSEDDLLGRAKFAQRLGDTIRDWNKEESIVIALYGPWGSGKTSILNLAVEQIEETIANLPEDKRPIVIRFNPWNFSEQNQILGMFFHEISTELGYRPASETLKKIGTQIQKYSSFLTPISKIPFPGLSVLSAPEKLGEAMKGFGDENLAKLKTKISELFKEMNQRIVIVIDDIDRLNEVEIRQMFQLVKLNADFPNTIYLLAFDREVVEKALETTLKISGRAYLEKIVQVAFDIPVIEPTILTRILFTEMDKLIADVPEENFDKVRWGNLYYGGLRQFFSSVRDIKRFINGFSFSFQLVSSEVNPIDFIGIEALRILAPKVYHAIARNKEIFTLTSAFKRSVDNNQLKQQYEEIFSLAGDEHKEAVREICQQLFPQIGGFYGRGHYGTEFQSEWRKAKRICATDIFDTYFLLGVPEYDISDSEMKKIIELASDQNKFADALQQMVQKGKIHRFLERMEDYTSDIPEANIQTICQVLMDISDELPDEKLGFFDLGPDIQISRRLYQLLKRLSPAAQRGELLEQVILNTPSIYTPIHEVSIHESALQEASEDVRLLEDSAVEQLKAICLEKIRTFAKSGTLKSAKKLEYILYCWRKWSDDASEIGNYINSLIQTTEGMLDLLAGFLLQQSSLSEGDYVLRKEWQIHLQGLKEFVNLGDIEQKLNSLNQAEEENLSERHKLALRTFRQEMQND
ncbi:hypothetical protein FJZ31_03545 [Candidatus Poribacteria bacterium]|nr:hypothetical protein [Candidatus Poribacteria bacterium]